jgi:pimeloyl-ACP methyl ester carboxylesterase
MGNSHVWDRFAAMLAGDMRAIAVDLRGHGDSEWVTPPAYSLQDYRDDVEALLQQMEARRYSVVGHSMGGLVGLLLAGMRPDAVEKLVVVDISAKPPIDQVEHLRAVGQKGHGVLTDYESTMKAAHAFLPEVDDDAVSWMVPYLFRRVPGGHSPKWDPETMAQLERWNVEPWLARIRCPVLIVRGESSHVLAQEEAELMAAQIDDCRIAEIPGAAHQVMLQESDAFAEVVRSFLKERPDAETSGSK